MTAQVEENLILNGKNALMAFCPPLPANDPRIIELKEDEIDYDLNGGTVFSTACWRGYIGSWEIKNNKFYLIKIEGRLQLKESPIFADWFTGTLRVPQGKKLNYIHMGFATVFEQELHIKIEKGEVKRSRIIDNRKKVIDEYKLRWDNMPGSENRFDGDDYL